MTVNEPLSQACPPPRLKPLVTLLGRRCQGCWRIVQGRSICRRLSHGCQPEKGLQKVVDKTNKVVKSCGMKINSKKTKVMIVDRNSTTIWISVESLKFANGYSEMDIRVFVFGL